MHPDLPPTPARAPRRVLARLCAVAVLCISLFATFSVSASADELDDRREELNRLLAQQSGAIDGASNELHRAIAAVNEAEDQLSAAEASLAEAESRVEQAQAATQQALAVEEQKQQEAHQAQRNVERAEASVAAARAAWDSVDHRTAEEINIITQQNGPLRDLALLFTDDSMADINQRVQMSRTILDGSALELDELESRRFIMEQAEVEAEQARAAAEKARDEAQAAREAAQQWQAQEESARDQAADYRAEIAKLVDTRNAARDDAAAELANEQSRQDELEREADEVDRRIQERIERQERERLERERLEREAREERAAQASRSQQRATESSSGSSNNASAPSAANSGSDNSGSAPSSDSGFIHPVSGPITSKYGMRVHPVTGVYKLHDGTDFGAACGVPIRAAADGTVTERYFNAGYGWRLMIDHGRIDGTYVTTGYNHATRYIVSPGQKVTQGQVVGYVGTTGYSTGCHLHLMTWENGKVVNPMSKWFS